MKILIATSNENKVREIRPILEGLPLELLTLADVSTIEPPEESASSYWENARIKAFAYANALERAAVNRLEGAAVNRMEGAAVNRMEAAAVDRVEGAAVDRMEGAAVNRMEGAALAAPLVVAEDSGLEIAGLDGAPGVHSARFLGADVPYRERFTEIYRRLANVPTHGRNARFVTALTAVRGGDVLFETEAAIDGVITPRPAGEHGFGYDPIFYYPPLQKTTAQLTLEEKCIVSHRARAFRDFARWLRHAQLT